MSEFSDRQIDLVPGVARGMRAFRVDDLGRLKGIYYSRFSWRPGENVRHCEVEESEKESLRWNPNAYLSKTPDDDPYKALLVSHLKNHSMDTCACGFYAYYDGSNTHAMDGSISGVIDGYGETMIGTRGFRASKARIVALCLPAVAGKKTPTGREPWHKRHPTAATIIHRSALSGASIGWIGSAATQLLGSGITPWGIAYGVIGALLGIYGFVMSYRLPIADLTPRPWKPRMSRWERKMLGKTVADLDAERRKQELVHRNYPDVPVFRSEKEMLAAFPLDHPEGPNPGDPGFWDNP